MNRYNTEHRNLKYIFSFLTIFMSVVQQFQMYDELVHSNVIRFGGLVYEPQVNKCLFFTEYCSKGSLQVGAIISHIMSFLRSINNYMGQSPI